MKLPRVRFTVRQIMLAAAVVALLAGAAVEIERRRARFHRVAALYRRRLSTARPSGWSGPLEQWEVISKRKKQIFLHNTFMKEKYEVAVSHPWLPVAPDPPEPE